MISAKLAVISAKLAVLRGALQAIDARGKPHQPSLRFHGVPVHQPPAHQNAPVGRRSPPISPNAGECAEPPEVCVCAAVQVPPNGQVFLGKRHNDCFIASHEVGLPHQGLIQGFWTNRSRFVDRYEGYWLQIQAEVKSAAEGGYRGQRLFSQDLY